MRSGFCDSGILIFMEPQYSTVQDKHKVAGKMVAEEFEQHTKEIHLRIKHRGTYTSWTARRTASRHSHGA